MKRSKMTYCIILALITSLPASMVSAQHKPESLTGRFMYNWNLGNDSSSMAFRPQPLVKSSIVPAAMFAVGISYADNIRDKGMIREYGTGTPDVKAADYMQYAPLVIMGSVKLMGIDGRGDWLRMCTTNAMAALLMNAGVTTLKYSVQRKRPDGSTNNSFPSGHTATSFMAATMLHKEYGETVSPWYSAVGYGIAGSVAVARVIENRHWCSDILAGAGIGTFSTLLAYELSDGIFGDRHLKKGIRHAETKACDKWQFNLASSYSFSSKAIGDSEIPENFKPSYSIGLDIDYLPWYIGPTVSCGVTQMQWTGTDRLFLDEGTKKPDVYWANIGLTGFVPCTDNIGCFARFTAGLQTGGDYSFHLNGTGSAVTVNISDGMEMKSAAGIRIKAGSYSALSAFIGIDWYHEAWRTIKAGTTFTLTL